jgi:hypothetical protein
MTIYEMLMIKIQTLAHFRHFSPWNLSEFIPECCLLGANRGRAAHLTYNRGSRHTSTPVENVRQINLFMQNKPNFPHF